MRCSRVGVLGGILGLALVLPGCGGGEATPTEQARPVLVVQPGRGDAGAASYAAEIRARTETALSFRVGGNVLERRVDVGDAVRQGDVLAVLDAGDLQAQARAAGAQLAAAEAELARARADQARFASLGKDRLVSRSTIDAQNAAATAAQAQVNAARASLQVAGNQAAYTQLRAPRAGVVAARHVEAGQVVAPGQPVFTLAGDGGREAVFAVSEAAVAGIQPGQPVEVEAWSRPGRRWSGRVREVAPAADPASRTFAVRAALDAPAGSFQLGQSARVFMTASRDRDAVVAVPLAAIQRVATGPAVYVIDRKTSTLRLQPVQLGPFGEDSVPVTRGIRAGEWVVAAGGHLLQAGQKVRAVDRDNRPVRL